MNQQAARSGHAGHEPDVRKSVPWIYFVIFFAVLNESVFNVSTPSIAKQFGLDAAGVSWVVTIFFIVMGIGMVVFGRLSDIFSVRKLITIGIIVYFAGSMLGFAAQAWYPAVILARAIQGVGGSAIPALVFVMVARYFSAEERGKLFGVITSTVSFAIGIGPVLGGFVAGTLHWSFLFLLPFPILAALPFFRRHLPKEPKRPGRLDIIGTLLLGAGISGLILFATDGKWLYLPIVLAALILFVLHIRRAREPFVEPSLFGNPLYRVGLVVGFVIFGSVMSVMFVIPLMLNRIYGFDTQVIGLIMFPGAMSAVVFGKVGGNLTVKRGSHYVIYLGLAFIAASLLVQSFSIGHWVWYIGAALLVMYIGFSFVQTALAESVTRILPDAQIGVGMGFFNMTSMISGAVVTALVSKAVERRLFAFPVNPFNGDLQANLYGNLILLICVAITANLLLYYVSFGKKAPQTVQEAS